MLLIMIGCEYAGKATLAVQLSNWMMVTMGLPRVRWHAHFELWHANRDIVVPAPEHPSGPDKEDIEELLALSPGLRERLQRHMIWRHLYPDMYRETGDCLMISFYYAEAVYAPLYYGYGEPGTAADRRRRARAWDAEIMLNAPDTVLILLRASREAIVERMRDNPRPGCPLREEDVPLVLERFEEEYTNSLILRRFALDTTDTSPAGTLVAFLRYMKPYLSLVDHLRVASRNALSQGGGQSDVCPG